MCREHSQNTVPSFLKGWYLQSLHSWDQKCVWISVLLLAVFHWPVNNSVWESSSFLGQLLYVWGSMKWVKLFVLPFALLRHNLMRPMVASTYLSDQEWLFFIPYLKNNMDKSYFIALDRPRLSIAFLAFHSETHRIMGVNLIFSWIFCPNSSPSWFSFICPPLFLVFFSKW